MKLKKIVLLSLVPILFSTGCGITSLAEETRDLTKQANDGMADSNNLQREMLVLQEEMLELMEHSNALQAQMIELMGHSNDLQEEMKKLMEDSNAQMATTVEYMRQQAVATAIAGLLAPDNTQQLDPPTKMIPYAQGLGDQATTDEIAQIAYVLYQDALYSTGSKTSREISLTAFGLIGAFLPLEKFKTILADQIDNQGLYEETIYPFAYLRYAIIRDLQFLPYIQKASVYNVAVLRDAVAQFDLMKQVAQLSYTDKLKLQISSLFLNESLDKTEITTLGKQAITRFKAKMSASDLQKQEVKDLLKHFEV